MDASRWSASLSGLPAKLGRQVLLTTMVPQQRTGWTKARKDVLQLLGQAGYSAMQLPMAQWGDWARMAGALKPRSDILVEYPFEQRKRAYALALLSRLRRSKVYALIHDLDTIRFDTPLPRELAILKLFDGLISHNPRMTAWLREAGIKSPVVELKLFDYHCAGPARTWSESAISAPLKVVFAGNLSFVKSGFIYDARLAGLSDVQLSLYGDFFERGGTRSRTVIHKGVFDPDAPQLDGNYHFGLVWDGTSVATCDGRYGHYMRFNNPHKLSLYIALGLPVIVWSESATAPFVRDQDIGLAVADLRELQRIPSTLASGDYRRMAQNAAALGRKVRQGDFLREAIGRLVGDADG